MASHLQDLCGDALRVLALARAKINACRLQSVLRRLPGHVQVLFGQPGQLGHKTGNVGAIWILHMQATQGAGTKL